MEGTCEGGTMVSVKKSDPILIQPKIEAPERFYFLSNLDHSITTMVKTLYCFKPKEGNAENVADVIKQGLDKTLVYYYPLAGELRKTSDGKLIVDCSNLVGVPFVEAVCECEMDVFVGDITVPHTPTLGQLIHTIPGTEDIMEMPLMTIQVTTFKCGGFTVGIVVGHCMVDGRAATEFINSWAEISRGIELKTHPFLDRSILASRQPPIIQFPHEEFREIEDISNLTLLYQEEQLVYKSFKFDLEKIDSLKKLAMEDGTITSCTTFTVLTAHVWRARTKGLKMKDSQETKLIIAIDGRSKFNPPLPKGYFGNGILLKGCVCSAGELIEKPFSFSVQLVQNAIKIVTEDYIRSAIDYYETTRANPTLTATLFVTTWTRLAFNSTDFGWGVPIETGCVTLPEKEMAIFLSTCGEDQNGITLLLGLPETAMKNFQELVQL